MRVKREIDGTISVCVVCDGKGRALTMAPAAEGKLQKSNLPSIAGNISFHLGRGSCSIRNKTGLLSYGSRRTVPIDVAAKRQSESNHSSAVRRLTVASPDLVKVDQSIAFEVVKDVFHGLLYWKDERVGAPPSGQIRSLIEPDGTKKTGTHRFLLSLSSQGSSRCNGRGKRENMQDRGLD